MAKTTLGIVKKARHESTLKGLLGCCNHFKKAEKLNYILHFCFIMA